MRSLFIVALAPLVFGQPAFAGCKAATDSAAGDLIVCDGIETRPIEADDSDGVTVRLNAAAQLNTKLGEDRAIDLGDHASVENSGAIYAGDEGIQGADGLDVRNAGQIIAAEKAIDANGGDARISNDFAALIESLGNEGIEAEDSAIIDNQGTIRAFDDAIQVGNAAFIINGGLIENTQTAADFLADPTLEAQDAIDIDSGEIHNWDTGTIRSEFNAAIDFDATEAASSISNQGLIQGTAAITVDAADKGQQSVMNGGRLVGTSGTALRLGMGDDSLLMIAGGIVDGGADFGAGADTLAFHLTYAFTDHFAGGAVFDGGTGEDRVIFGNLNFGDVAVIHVDGTAVSLLVHGQFQVNLVAWEEFGFLDRVVSFEVLMQ